MTMLSNETVRKLHEMRLGVMAEAFSTQLEDVQFQSVSFEDRFAMLVDGGVERPEKQPPDPAYPQRWLRGPRRLCREY